MEKLIDDKLDLKNADEAIKEMNRLLEISKKNNTLVNFETVSVHHLSSYKNAKVMHIFQEACEDTTTHTNYTNNGSEIIPLVSKTVNTYAIIAYPVSDVVEELYRGLQMANQTAAEYVAENSKAKKEIVELEKRALKAEGELVTARKHTLDYSNEAKEAWGRLSQYEKDINKLRNAIGEIRMNEILGSDK